MRKVAMSRSIRIRGPAAIRGSLRVPGDKSISHRVALLASIAEGLTTITGFASSVDCHSTLDCIRRLGITVEKTNSPIVIHGNGLFGYQSFDSPVQLDAGNSGSTIRMLSGLLAGQRIASEITGDASLRRRPMARIINPLRLMGAKIEATADGFPPLKIQGNKLSAIDYSSPVASAQVKTCVLLAGLLAEGQTVFSEPSQSRDHTELMLREFGVLVNQYAGALAVEGLQPLKAVNYNVPGDLSSAAFFIAAASVLPDSVITITDVSLNPTRTAILDVMKRLGAAIQTENKRERHGEPIGDLIVSSASLRADHPATRLDGAIIPNIIDEIPILAVIATQLEGRLEVRDARELRIKESDRIATVARGIRSLGGNIEEFEDGFAIEGPQKLTGATVETAGDHRIAMAFAIAGLMANGTTEIVDADCASVSFPGFYESLASVSGGDTVVSNKRVEFT